MTTTNGILNGEFNEYVDRWAKMQVKIWQERMMMHWIGTSKNATGSLYNSLDKNISPQHDRVDFTLNRYGLYVEAGIGPEFGENGKIGRTRNVLGRFAENPKRQPKPWLSGNYWYSRQKLAAKMVELTGTYFLESISQIIEDSK